MSAVPRTTPLRLLIVDDSNIMRRRIERCQNIPQLEVVGSAANGLDALELFCKTDPDVVTMDITMPHMDGIEATSRIRADFPDIQVLGLSMQPRNAATDAIEQAGAAAFFVKGTETQRLIDHLLGMHALRPGRLEILKRRPGSQSVAVSSIAVGGQSFDGR